MKKTEYEKVKDFTYLEYCDYLQDKYGIGLADYMTVNYVKNNKVSRTGEGLIAHHKMEDRAIMLSTKEYAKANPYEWQLKENIVYCDYLEHLLLHVLICKYPSIHKNLFEKVGFGGVVNYIVPELNDLYSGWETSQAWREKCHALVKDDKDVYMLILKQFMEVEKKDRFFNVKMLLSSFNAGFGKWDKKNNLDIYKEILVLARKEGLKMPHF